jgi:hypothetical protein
MLGLPLAFTAPFVLIALALLPALWRLLRVTPPRPRQIAFPPLRLILDLEARAQTPARTPLWLLLMRMALVAAIILAMAGPVWNPPAKGLGGKGPLLVALDNGWPAAIDWERRVALAGEALTQAAREGRPGAVLALSEGARDVAPAESARLVERLRAIKPVSYAPDRMASLAPIRKFAAAHPDLEVLWIADGLAMNEAAAFAQALKEAARGGAVRTASAERTPAAIVAVAQDGAGLEAQLARTDARARADGVLRAYDLKGLLIGESRFAFGAERATQARLDLPTELRNEIARLEIDGERTAGAVALLDSRWKRRRVAIVSGAPADLAQPLLSPTYYVARALAPFAEVREPRVTAGRDPILVALEERPSMLILADVGVVAGPTREKLTRYVEDGGLLLRFAGARLAAAADDLTPVRLRRGGRVLGGALSWESPRKLAPFDQASPFHGLAPSAEVTVGRQVLAEPEAGLAGKTWAALEDGTPLVTGARRGKGLVVLAHVTADATWSNLPLSGLFVDMLRRTLALSGESAEGAASGTGNDAVARAQTLPPVRTLDGFGQLGEPPATARPIAAGFAGLASSEHPAGFYGPVETMIAVNATDASVDLSPADYESFGLSAQPLRAREPLDLRLPLMLLAFALLLADALATLVVAGGLRMRRPGARRAAASRTSASRTSASRTSASLSSTCLALAALACALAGQDARAQSTPPAREFDSALRTRLAYVVTGDARVDEASRLGLATLTRALSARTALSPGDPAGVDPARDELAFFPLIYWPVAAERPQPGAAAAARIGEFMRQGGTVLFDTRDALSQRPGGQATPEAQWLRRLLADVDVPELEPVPRDHVVTKTFYLLDSFVGRTMIGQTWIEALPATGEEGGQRPARAGDSVSPILITSNDLAAAWAADASGKPLYPLTPGAPRQREMAIRGGVNIVMYTLTGNYKADQVHVRDLLERLGL